MVEHVCLVVLLVVIGKADAFILDAVLEGSHYNCVGHLCYSLVGIEYFEYSHCRGAAFLQTAVSFDNSLDRRYQTGKDDDEKYKYRCLDVAAQHGVAAQYEYKSQPDGSQHFRQRAAGLLPPCHAHHTSAVVPVDVFELFLPIMLTPVGLHNFQIVQRFFVGRHHLAKLLLSFYRVAFQAFAYLTDKKHGGRQNNEEKQEQSRTDEYQRGGKDNHINRVFNKRLQGAHNAPFDVGKVCRHTADEVAFAFAREEGNRQNGYLVVYVVAQPSQHPVADGAEEKEPQIACQVVQQHAYKVAAGKGKKTGPQSYTLLVLVQMIHRPVGQRALVEAESRLYCRRFSHTEEQFYDRHNKHKRE